MTPLLDRRALFVTGKGGVGKTVVTAALAQVAAEAGRRVLVTDLDGRGDQRATFASSRLAFAPTNVAPRIDAMAMISEDSLAEYLRIFLRLPRITRLGLLARTFTFVANAAPGVKEILGIGKVTYELEEDNYDLVIVDAPASGHVLGHLNAPQTLRELTKVGLVQQQTSAMVELMADPTQAGCVLVATPEEMPVTETLELAARIDAESAVEVAAVVLNRVLPPVVPPEHTDVFEQLATSLRKPLVAAAGPGTASVLDTAMYASNARSAQAEHIARLIGGFDRSMPVLSVGEVFGLDTGPAMVETIARGLAEQLSR